MRNKVSFDINSVPKDWSIIPCGVFFREKSIKNTKGEMNLSVYRDYGVIPTDSRNDNHNKVSEDTSNYKLVNPGNFVLNKMKGWSGSLGVSNYRGIVSPSYTVLEPGKKIHNKYFHYLLRSEPYRQMYESLSYGVRIGQWELRYHDFKEIPSLYPPIEEQKLISHYLDKKTEQIDKSIDKIQKKIELLKEQQISHIYQCTTKGLDPNVDMKDSSVEWIGMIPKHWSLRKLNHFYTYQKGSMGQKLTSSYLDENSGEYPVYSGQTSNNGILGTWSDYEFDFNTEVIFCTTVGARLMTTQVLSGKFSLSQNCLIMIPKDISILSKYINYFLLYDFRIRRELLPSILQPSLRMEDLDQYQILIPPVEEQIKIVDLVSQHMILSENVISKLMTKILLLKEYRKSLISYVVTGKVRVTKDMI